MSALYDKHRPKKWEDVVGQKAAIKAFRSALNDGMQQFILTGPSGSGKTTSARIAAAQVGCHDQNLMDIAAAKFTGIDDMRRVQEAVGYSPMGGSKTRVVIVDECHGLSKQAWDSLLKAVEEPAKHVYWFFCTTELQKVPKTIRTRCATITFDLVEDDIIRGLVEDVCDAEKFKTPDNIIDLVVRAAEGSPRMALSCLGKVARITDKKEAAAALAVLDDDAEAIELIRLIVNGGGSWTKALGIIDRMTKDKENFNYEGVRIVMVNYIAAVLKNTKDGKKAKPLLNMLYQFSTPYNTSEKIAPLLLSIGNVLLPD